MKRVEEEQVERVKVEVETIQLPDGPGGGGGT